MTLGPAREVALDAPAAEVWKNELVSGAEAAVTSLVSSSLLTPFCLLTVPAPLKLFSIDASAVDAELPPARSRPDALGLRENAITVVCALLTRC